MDIYSFPTTHYFTFLSPSEELNRLIAQRSLWVLFWIMCLYTKRMRSSSLKHRSTDKQYVSVPFWSCIIIIIERENVFMKSFAHRSHLKTSYFFICFLSNKTAVGPRHLAVPRCFSHIFCELTVFHLVPQVIQSCIWALSNWIYLTFMTIALAVLLFLRCPHDYQDGSQTMHPVKPALCSSC